MSSERLCSIESEQIIRTYVQNWSHYVSLTSEGTEKDCLVLVELLDRTRLSWKAAAAESQVYKERVAKLENQMKEKQKAHELSEDRLRNCQAEMSALMTKYNCKELEVEELKQKLEKAKNILRTVSTEHEKEYLQSILNTSRVSPTKASSKLAQSINNTTTTPENMDLLCFGHGKSALPPILDEESENEDYSHSDIDYDKTGDSLESSEGGDSRRASRKRRSRSVTAANRSTRFEEDIIGTEVCPSKKVKNEVHEVIATTTIKIDPTGARKPSGSVAIRRSMNRSMSESTLDNFGSKNRHNFPTTPVVSTLRSPQCLGSSWTNNLPIPRRTHRVAKLISIRESCDVCNRYFGIASQNALRCIDCEIRFHRACHTRAPMPCVPRVTVPKSAKKLHLKAYCIKSHPMIPPLIIHCVLALEKDRLNFEGIYRISSSDTAVSKLYQDFLTKRVAPSLGAIETETICGCIKKFLQNIQDSLIPDTSFDEFSQAAENGDDQVMVNLVLALPPANRDTLTYLLCHLQIVAKHASHNKMPIENLARVLGPTIIRYSSFVTASLESSQVATRYQYLILIRLLKIPQEFWQRFIDENMTMVLHEESKTPGSRREFLTPISSKTEPRRLRDRFATPGEAPQDSSPLITPLNVQRQPVHFQDPLEF